jgi:hypothetical protein
MTTEVTETTTEATNDTLLTETVDMELTTEDTLYGKDQEVDETVDETKEEAKDSEKVDDVETVAKSEEEAESGETEEEATGEDEKVEYKLELKSDSVLDNSMFEGIEAFARENNLSEDVAKGLLSKQEELLIDFVNMKTQELEAQKDTWREQVINDKTLGGENLDKTIESARRVVTKFGNEAFINMLKETGYGDNVEVVRFFSKIGSMMSDDTLVTGNEFGGEKPVEDYFYGSN